MGLLKLIFCFTFNIALALIVLYIKYNINPNSIIKNVNMSINTISIFFIII